MFESETCGNPMDRQPHSSHRTVGTDLGLQIADLDMAQDLCSYRKIL